MLAGRISRKTFLLDRHLQKYGRRVGEVPEPRLHREDVADRTVDLYDSRHPYRELPELHLVRGADRLNLDLADLVDDVLHPLRDELVVAVEMLPGDALALEEVTEDYPGVVLADLDNLFAHSIPPPRTCSTRSARRSRCFGLS